ncbi:centrosomal protein of 120 kDa [Toxotes jaculatrix]|uniref:centrosomal protein of 120 kDa n=1 Tax=Toxotes jaculatrix TaxID=941984 RepID=UPI001B3A9AEC|nr:centrosomal protein of 120 kDa [Toxotes jaculatrix]XP_040899114.1 centrosomal protein of 120 kDa [Toxotes jaculatrix]
MASKTDQLLIVVSILEGRHFPKSPRLSLVVQASFDGEQLATDPVEHREQPQFSTELAWELDRRTLHQHRLQRTPIKLQCFAVDSVSKRKESVGYIVLDLRSVQEVKQEPRWYPLLSSKYTKQRPALLLGVVLENDTKPSEPSPDRFKARKAPPRQGSPAAAELLPDRLEATLIPDQGYHQVGPADHCTDMFVLSVTVAFASKLEQLIPSTMKLSAEGSEFFFYYSLLGNDITSEPFHNLLNPDFEPERASVRIHSSKQILQAFLSQQPSLQIHLCCGNHSLGSTDVSLSALSAVSVDLENKAATVEGAFILQPPKRIRQTLPALPADLQPTVGVAVTLRREEVTPLSLGNKEEGGVRTHIVPRPSLPPSAPPAEQRPRSSSPVRKPRDSSPPGPPLLPPSSHTESEAESLLEELQHGKDQTGLADLEVPVQLQSQTEATAEGGASSVSVSAPKVSIPSSAHHYSFSLDLRSLGNLSLTHPIRATLRYSYQFFGSAAPIMTNPPVELQRNMEVSLPQSYCAFNFAALPQQLQDTFLRVPLVVEVWSRDSTRRDQLMGRASIQLSHLLSSERSRIPASAGEQSWRQTHQDRIPVVKTQRPTEKVAELSYVATLEDLGLVKAREVIVSDSSQNERVAQTQPSSHPVAPRPAAPSLPTAPLGPTTPIPPTNPRDTLEYRMALELELWKEEQEDLFDDQLRKKELSHMQALAEEWRRRDREREALVKKKEVEYNLLEEQLQKTLSDFEKREKQLAEAELETQRLQRELRAEHDLAQRELQESSRRLQQECDHRVALERDKVRLMEEERAGLLQQVSAGESRYKQLEKEFQLYREQQNIRPEFRLQSEINLLTLEKVELERKLETTTKSKLHYKQQWGRALKELARFKQREQEMAMTRLKKQQAELEAMRLRYLATEEKAAVRQDRQELDDIRNELNRLKQHEDRLGPASSPPGPAPGPGLSESADEHLSRLLEERDTLLRTGVYTHEDRIIAELNRQIQDAMRDRGNL